MKKIDIELIVGVFVLLGLISMAYTSINLGRIEFFRDGYYQLEAIFSSVTGLRKDTPIEISGVQVGKVDDIRLEDYKAVVTISIRNDIEIQEDAIASVQSKGILGEKYISISPGASDIILKPGDVIFDTEPAFDILSIIRRLMVGE